MNRTKMKIKQLILPFGYRTLTGLCARKGWVVPSREQVIAMREDIDHTQVWVSDEPTDPADRETHGYVYDIEQDRLILTHEGFMEPAVVITSTPSTGSGTDGSEDEVVAREVDFDLEDAVRSGQWECCVCGHVGYPEIYHNDTLCGECLSRNIVQVGGRG